MIYYYKRSSVAPIIYSFFFATRTELGVVQNEAILQPRSARAGFLAPPFSEAHPAAPLPPRSLRQTAEGRGLPNTLSNPVGLCVRL